MINNLAESGLKSFEEYSIKKDYEFLYSVFENMAKSSKEEFILADKNLKILFSNSKIAEDNDNIFEKLQINYESLSDKKISFVRTIEENCFEYIYRIFITPIFTDEKTASGYLFILEDISDENFYKTKYLDLVEILKHELKVSVCAQTMVSKLLTKKYPQDELMLELYNSCNETGKTLQNCIENNSNSETVYQVFEKNVYIKTFVNNVFAECKSFLKENNNKIQINTFKNQYIFIDSMLMKKALITLIKLINDNCGRNKTLVVNIDSDCVKIEIKTEGFILPKADYLNSDKSLQLVKSVISAHKGRLISKKYNNTTVITIYIPKNQTQ